MSTTTEVPIKKSAEDHLRIKKAAKTIAKALEVLIPMMNNESDGMALYTLVLHYLPVEVKDDVKTKVGVMIKNIVAQQLGNVQSIFSMLQ